MSDHQWHKHQLGEAMIFVRTDRWEPSDTYLPKTVIEVAGTQDGRWWYECTEILASESVAFLKAPEVTRTAIEVVVNRLDRGDGMAPSAFDPAELLALTH